jgi:hypothetical protein
MWVGVPGASLGRVEPRLTWVIRKLCSSLFLGARSWLLLPQRPLQRLMQRLWMVVFPRLSHRAPIQSWTGRAGILQPLVGLKGG